MDGLFTLESLGHLGVLIFLQAVLGFDNLLYISIESKRAPEAQRSKVRRIGILLALALRVLLLFAILTALESFSAPFYTARWEGVLEGAFNFATVIFLFGGGFVIYVSVKEIRHMLALEELEANEEKAPRSAARAIAMIALMNLIFSFDSILSAIAITRVTAVLILAIMASSVLMMVLADHVADFLQRNKKYEILGLFILLIVGVVLLGEGGHEAHLKLFGHAIEPMSKATFYFSIAVLVVVDVLQSGYQKKLARRRERETLRASLAPAEGAAAEGDDA